MRRRRPPPRMRWQDLLRRLNRKRPPESGSVGGVPVEPDKPNSLSGGAAAELEFDDD